MNSTRIRRLTEQERKCLERFAVFEMSLDQLRSCLRDVMKFDFDAANNQGKRWMETNFIAPEPGVLISKGHLENALMKKRNREISDEQLIEWATMILHNHAYELDEKDEDSLAEWLNNISFDLGTME